MADDKEVQELIELSQKGDSDAFSALIIKHERFVYNVAYRMMQNTEDAKDLSQEALIKAFRHIGKFDGKASFSTWLYRIVVNTCLDELRKRKNKETFSMDAQMESEDGDLKMQVAQQGQSIEEQVVEKENIKAIIKAMDELSEEHKVVIVLRDFKGLSYQEIAEITNSSMGTIKSRLARGRKNLKEIVLKQWNKA